MPKVHINDFYENPQAIIDAINMLMSLFQDIATTSDSDLEEILPLNTNQKDYKFDTSQYLKLKSRMKNKEKSNE